MLTEEKAKERWCFRTYRPGEMFDYDKNENVPDPEHVAETGCIGSACMAWRWGSPGEDMGRQHKAPGAERHGYCGLAGKP